MHARTHTHTHTHPHAHPHAHTHTHTTLTHKPYLQTRTHAHTHTHTHTRSLIKLSRKTCSGVHNIIHPLDLKVKFLKYKIQGCLHLDIHAVGCMQPSANTLISTGARSTHPLFLLCMGDCSVQVSVSRWRGAAGQEGGEVSVC